MTIRARIASMTAIPLVLLLAAYGSPEPTSTRLPTAAVPAPAASPNPTPTAATVSTPAHAASPTPASQAAMTPEQTPTSSPTPRASSTPTPRPAPQQEAVNDTGFPLVLPAGFRISLFAPESIGPLRFMAFSPDGTLFVSLPSNSGLYAGNTTGGTVFALPDRDQDGKADEVTPAITGLKDRPHGLAFYDGYLYLAEESRISRYLYMGNGNVGAREVLVQNRSRPVKWCRSVTLAV